MSIEISVVCGVRALPSMHARRGGDGEAEEEEELEVSQVGTGPGGGLGSRALARAQVLRSRLTRDLVVNLDRYGEISPKIFLLSK